ncbi:MAG: uncharacterized protein KVP18_004645 [Porospora cf. gigantea A]|nr:MAG: hypothetical protein KVP18_004645 [Porospora cf. gigantea A]
MDLLKKISRSLTHGSKRPAQSSTPKSGKAKFTMDDFTFDKVVGVGSFGRVFRAKIEGGTVVAIKRLVKSELIRRRQVTHINCERSILLAINHPLVVQCLGSFKDDKYVYLILEYVGGAEFFTYLRKMQKLPEEHCKFYVACIILTWEYLHNKEIVFRDLKPENLLIDHEGYMKLTDFGFAKRLPKGLRTTTMCGTPDYMAPEILRGDRYSYSVDWWSLGVLIYEMLYGIPPFSDKDNKGTYSKILNGLIRFPRGASAMARGCMKRLLTHDPERR